MQLDASRIWVEPEHWESHVIGWHQAWWAGPGYSIAGKPLNFPQAWRSPFILRRPSSKSSTETGRGQAPPKESYSTEMDPVPWIQPCLKPAALSLFFTFPFG